MKKKILSIAIILTLVFSFSVAFATENEIPNLNDAALGNLVDENSLTASDDIEDIINKTLVDSLISPSPNATSDTVDGNKIIGEEKAELKDTTVNGNLIIFAQDLNLENVEVNGDVAIFGQNIKISKLSVVNGATVIAGQKIDINTISTVGNVYIAGEDVSAEIFARDLYSACSRLTLRERTEISKVYDYSGKLFVEGGSYEIINAGVENLSVGANTVITKGLNYSSENEADINTSAKIGNIDFNKKEKEEPVEVKVTQKDMIVSKVNAVISAVVKSLAVCGFIFLCAEGFIKKTKVQDPVKYIGFSALKGLGWTFAFPIVSIVLLLTGFAAGISVVLLIIYFIIFWAALPIVSIAVMNAIIKEKPSDKKKAYGITILVAGALAILGQVPVIGGLVKLIVALAGFGIFMGALKPSKEPKAEEAKPVVVEKEVEKVEEPKSEDNNSEKNK